MSNEQAARQTIQVRLNILLIYGSLD